MEATTVNGTSHQANGQNTNHQKNGQPAESQENIIPVPLWGGVHAKIGDTIWFTSGTHPPRPIIIENIVSMVGIPETYIGCPLIVSGQQAYSPLQCHVSESIARLRYQHLLLGHERFLAEKLDETQKLREAFSSLANALEELPR